VPGNTAAMNRIAPNSKMREFQVDRKWDMYSRRLMSGPISANGSSTESELRDAEESNGLSAPSVSWNCTSSIVFSFRTGLVEGRAE
jgi:hypothetical protein